MVSGKKVRYKENGYNLDLTYICPRIIGMSFPASGLESAYRNHIDEVSNLLNEKHPNSYLVFNLSGRPYDFARFNNNVKTVKWEDHHSPPIHKLFECCAEMHRYLKGRKKKISILAMKSNIFFRISKECCCSSLFSRQRKDRHCDLLLFDVLRKD